MAVPEENQDSDKFVEVDGVKYKEDPENLGQALKGENDELVPFEEKEEETPEEKEEREKKEKEEEEEEEKKPPPTRKSVQDHIIERQKKKIKKLKKEGEEEEEEEEDEEGKEEEDEEGKEEVTSEGKKAISKEIERKVRPILQTVRTQSDDQELKDVFAKYPDASKMETQIRKYMDHPKYAGVSIEFIFLGLAAKKMKLEGKKKVADEEAKEDATGGHEKRKKELGPIPDVRKMEDKDFETLLHQVRTGQFK